MTFLSVIWVEISMTTNETLARIRAARTDITDWLIHWTHDNWDYSEDYPQQVFAGDVLEKILADGWLTPSFSKRGKGSTVYGPDPAVCFTEQTLADFARSVLARGNQQKATMYGVAIPKLKMFQGGGRPVIYGMHAADELTFGHPGYDKDRRNLNPVQLPYHEQYRYVVFALPGIDWSHEREWRWKAQSWNSTDETDHENFLPGFPLAFDSSARDSTILPVLVKTEEDVNHFEAVVQDIATRPTPFEYQECYRQRLARRVRVLSLQNVIAQCDAGNLAYSRIETHPKCQ